MSRTSKVVLIGLGVAMLGFLGWAVSDGAIYFKGGVTKRADHPVLFWVEAAVLAGIAGVVIYTAVTYQPKDQDRL
jgi:hypothetical protein